MNICPRCDSPYEVYCIRCGYGSIPAKPPEPPKPKIQKPYSQIGRALVNGDWGPNTTSTMLETLQSGDLQMNTVAILAAILQELQATRNAMDKAVNRLIRAIERAPNKAEIALEKERQKTADKQRKANEALPAQVNVIQCPNEVLARIPQRRLRGKW